MRGLYACIVILVLCVLPSPCAASLLVDWTQWNATWISADLGPQSLVVSPTQTVTYTGAVTGSTVFLAGTPDVLIDIPRGFPFNGTGGAADHYLDLFQDQNLPGEGSVHTFTFSEPVDGLTVDIWDIDANNRGGDNYIDEITVTATLQSGTTVAPTFSFIHNPTFVQQDDADTWRGIPFISANDNTDQGTVEIHFDYSSIVELQVDFVNSARDTTPGQPSGNHAIGIYDLRVNEALPEPSSRSNLLMAAILMLGLRKRRTFRS